MRRSHKPRTPAQFLVLASIILAVCASIYLTVNHALERIGDRAHLQEQQLKQRPPVTVPAQQTPPWEWRGAQR